MNPNRLLFATATLCASAAACAGQSVWLPTQGQFKATPGFAFSTFDEFWLSKDKISNPPNGDPLNQYTGYLSLEYGILGNLAADLTFGYTATDTDAFGGDASDDGLMDTSFGLRYRLLDERSTSLAWAPTVGVRLGGVVPGTYDENQPFSAGDGAYALEGSLQFGKSFGQSGFGIYGDIGYRWRESPVPNDIFGTAGIFQQFGPVTASVGYRHIQGLSGIDIDDSDFNPALGPSHGFPALKEINQLVEAGVSFTDKGGRNYQFSVAKSVDGRNTGDKWVFGFNVTLPFGGN